MISYHSFNRVASITVEAPRPYSKGGGDGFCQWITLYGADGEEIAEITVHCNPDTVAIHPTNKQETVEA